MAVTEANRVVTEVDRAVQVAGTRVGMGMAIKGMVRVVISMVRLGMAVVVDTEAASSQWPKQAARASGQRCRMKPEGPTTTTTKLA